MNSLLAGSLALLTFFLTGYGKSLLFIAIVLFLIHQALYLFGAFSPGSEILTKTVRGRDFFSEKKGILFRFDDGPDPRYTLPILEILKKYNQKAIFFVTGENAKKHAQLIKKIQDENHLIGNHTFSHPYHFLFLSARKIAKEIQATNRIIRDITGKKPVYFGPPMGHKSFSAAKAASRLNMEIMMWDVNSKDTRCDTPAIIQSVLAEAGEKDIVLFHDGVYKWTQPERNATVEALPVILEKIVKKFTTDNPQIS